MIGPDEYTEHVNNNAYTNYLARHNVASACRFISMFEREEACFMEGDHLHGPLVAAGKPTPGSDPAGRFVHGETRHRFKPL